MFSYGTYSKSSHAVIVTDPNAIIGKDNLLGKLLDIDSGGLGLREGQTVEFEIAKKGRKYVAKRVKANP